MVERHEGLRTRFRVDNGIPVQLIDPPGVFALQVEDLSALPEAERTAAARERSRAITQQPFCLEQGSLFRAHLLRLSGEDHIAVVSMHHIVSDGWSIGVLIREVGALYGAYSDGRGSPLPELAVQYADYAVWQREWLQGAVLEKQVGYWKQRLSGAPGALELPTDRVRPAVQSYRGAHHGFGFPAHLTVGLNELGRSEGATLFMVLLTAFNVVLWRWSGQSDIVVGSPIAGRTHRELEGLIGFFVNTLALRTELGGRPSFRELVGRVKETALGAYAHQDLPFEKLVAELSPVRDLSRQPIFQVLFALQNVPQETLELPGLRLSRIGSDQATAKFDLSLHVYEREGKLEGYFEYATDLFEGSTVARIASHFRTLLEGVVADPDLPLGELPLLPARERRQLLEEWNATAAAYPRDKCLHELFAEQAARTPDAVALVYEDSELSYGELDRRSNQLAHYLRGLGVGPETVVGLCVERSLEMVVGLLGILKAGGAYLPLDPGYPAERLAYMVGDAKAPVLVTQARLAGDLPAHGAQVVEIDADWARIERCPAGMPRNLSLPDNLAYVIYTSGSTGKPKGVSVRLRGVMSYFAFLIRTYGLDTDSTTLHVSSISFDPSIRDLLGPLLSGGRLVILHPRDERNPKRYLEVIQKNKVTNILSITPSLLGAIIDSAHGTGSSVESLQHILSCGEVLHYTLCSAAGMLFGRAQLVNQYGPTECTMSSSYHLVTHTRDAHGVVPLGRPINNSAFYVLDADLTPVPIGVGGELYIGGVGLARGYLGRAGLTGERFVPSPFGDGERLYRTGDLARWRADGELEYLGRIDHQVKVRGYRIELGEIEARLVEHDSVGQAVVVARDEGADRQLVAYIVGDGVAAEPSLLRAHLKHSLPDYMMPSAFVLLDALPLTPNGKVDRRALPIPEDDAVVRGEYVAPRTPVEELLASIWCEVLKLDRVGINDNFFELGGHSLLAMRLVARARDAFQTELPLRALFEAPSLGGLATRIEAAQREGSGLSLPPLVAMKRPAVLPLSHEQERLWLLEQIGGLGSAYNNPVAVRLLGDLNVAALEACFGELARRHESLRTRFETEDGTPRQVVDEPRGFVLDVVDFENVVETKEREAKAHSYVGMEALHPFDLSHGPLFRVKLLRLGAKEHVVVVVMHHIVSDGWSIGVLIREVGELYAAFVAGRPSPLPELPVQNADYALWQRSWLHGELLEKLVSYWKDKLSGAPTALDLPTDYARPAAPSYRGASVGLGLSVDLTHGINELARSERATPFMVLLAAFNLVLSRWSGQSDIVVGAPIAGRTHRELEGLIGFFTNTLALRTELSDNPTFRCLIQRVKETALDAYAHQELPFEKLVTELQPLRDPSRQPIFQVLFVLQNFPHEALKLPGLQLSRMGGDHATSKLDLSLYLHERGGVIGGHFEYATDLFEQSTIERLASHFRVLLEAIVADSDVRLSELPLLPESERRQLLEKWNDTAAEYPKNKCLHELFAEQAAKTPNAVALVCEDSDMTYGELDRRSNHLALHLRRIGVKSETVVGLYLDRSFAMVISMLAVLKSGGVYLPLEPSSPPERIDFMLNDANADYIITCQTRRGEIGSSKSAVLVMADTESKPVLDDGGEAGIQPSIHSDRLAYIVYTSGSTGQPKGVMVSHRALMNFLFWREDVFALDPTEKLFFKASFSSDFAIPELFWPLFKGASVVIATREDHADPVAMIETIKRHGITRVEVMPSLLSTILEVTAFKDCASVRTIICGGEVLPKALVSRCSSVSKAEIINVYGPTEATVETTYWHYDSNVGTIPIGRPIANVQLYVLDDDHHLVPIGVPGELYIGGVGLARGYLNRPGLTAERFIPSPFGGGERLYRTGDSVRYLPDSSLEFLGRLDHQVKVRGYRIELGEVEKALQEHVQIRQAVVVARGEGVDRQLVAYIVGDGASPEASVLRAHLKQSLPDYMLPSAFVPLEALPLTPNGKIDRRALPAPEGDAVLRGEYVAPRTPAEEMLAAIWAEVLKLDRIGSNDNFFELGGHSLLAIKMIVRISEKVAAEVPLITIFGNPKLSSFAAVLDQVLLEKGLTTSITPEEPSLDDIEEGMIPLD